MERVREMGIGLLVHLAVLGWLYVYSDPNIQQKEEGSSLKVAEELLIAEKPVRKKEALAVDSFIAMIVPESEKQLVGPQEIVLKAGKTNKQNLLLWSSFQASGVPFSKEIFGPEPMSPQVYGYRVNSSSDPNRDADISRNTSNWLSFVVPFSAQSAEPFLLTY